MRGARLQFEQEILVEVVILPHADVVSSKGTDRLLGLPERDHQEMCGLALHATQRVSAFVAGSRAVIGYGDGSHQVQVLIAFCCGPRAMPDSGDHAELLGHHLRPELLDVATGRLHLRPRAVIENLALRLRSTGFAVLAYCHAASG